jgi:signal transduction histidine kinase
MTGRLHRLAASTAEGPLADAAVAAGLAVVALFEIAVTTGLYSVHERLPAAVAGAVVLCGALWWRRRHPLLVAVLVLAAFVAVSELGVVPQGWLMPYILVLAYSTGAYARGRESAAGVVVTMAMAYLIGRYAADDPGPTTASDYVFIIVLCGAPWLAGHVLRSRHEQAAAARQAAIADERARIARELHDIIAHSLSVVAIQSDAAEHALSHDPALVREPLRAITRTAQDALAEMRRLVAVLRVGDEKEPLQPQPGLAQLDTLIDEVRATGTPVALHVDGDRAALPPGLDLAAYRIVQEALTNARRHAGPSTSARVRVHIDDGDVDIEVTDDGAGQRPPSAPGNGHGLLGLRERVALYGGQFDAGAVPGGGFRIHARLPIGGADR